MLAIFIGNIPSTISKEQIIDYLLSRDYSGFTIKGKPKEDRRYIVLHFKSSDMYSRMLKDRTLCYKGFRFKPEKFRGGSDRKRNDEMIKMRRIFAGGLPIEIGDDRALCRAFRRFGIVENGYISKNSKGSAYRYGFVTFRRPEVARMLIEKGYIKIPGIDANIQIKTFGKGQEGQGKRKNRLNNPKPKPFLEKNLTKFSERDLQGRHPGDLRPLGRQREQMEVRNSRKRATKPASRTIRQVRQQWPAGNQERQRNYAPSNQQADHSRQSTFVRMLGEQRPERHPNVGQGQLAYQPRKFVHQSFNREGQQARIFQNLGRREPGQQNFVRTAGIHSSIREQETATAQVFCGGLRGLRKGLRKDARGARINKNYPPLSQNRVYDGERRFGRQDPSTVYIYYLVRGDMLQRTFFQVVRDQRLLINVKLNHHRCNVRMNLKELGLLE